MVRMSEQEFKQLGKRKSGQAKPKPLSETDRKTAVREYLAWHGWEVTNHFQSLGSRKGYSDLTALKDGWTVYIEMKTDTGRLSEDQEKFRDAVISRGGTYVIARSVEDVEFLTREPVKVLWQRYRGKVVEYGKIT